MEYIICFETDKFDAKKESENSLSPMYGESLLLWLKDQVKDELDITEPDAEDWGWYAYLKWKGRKYLLCSSAWEEDNGQYEWVLEVNKKRSFKEILLRKEKMEKNDECLLYLQNLLEKEKSFNDITVE